MTISNANPIQFWLNGEETFNQKEECSITTICFCQQFNCSDEIRIQFQDTTGRFFELVVYNSSNIEINRLDFVEVSAGVYSILFNDTSPAICQTLRFSIEEATTLLSSWASESSPVVRVWQSVTYGNGLFVAVANDGIAAQQIMTSPDGITWTSRTSPNVLQWKSITYGNGIFVAVAQNGVAAGQVMTSINGLIWTGRTSASARAWYSITYGNGLFVAVATTGATAGQVMTSTDGITWTSRTSASGRQWSSITYGNGLFVAVADDGAANIQIMTSPDGITWTSRTSPNALQWEGVTYGNGIFVAVAFNGTAPQQIMTSSDGITWTSRTSPSVQQWISITYSNNGIFVAVGYDGTIMSSVDGMIWTLRTSPSVRQWRSVINGEGLFVAVSNDGIASNQVMRSSLVKIEMATSDCIALSDDDDCTKLVTYSNSNDFAGLVYSEVSPAIDFSIRLPAVFFEESFPDEYEALDLSDSEMVQLRSEVKHKKLLELDYMPFYMYKKLQLILAHDSITIDSLPWIKLDPLNIVQARRTFPLRRASILLTEKDFVERNIL